MPTPTSLPMLMHSCWCWYFQMVLQNYSYYKNPGTGNWTWALFLFDLIFLLFYSCLISLKLENLGRRWRTAPRFQIFLMVTYLFIHDVLYAHIRLDSTKKPCHAQKTVVSTKKYYTWKLTLRNKIMWVKKKYVAATKKIVTLKKRLMLTKYVSCCT